MSDEHRAAAGVERRMAATLCLAALVFISQAGQASGLSGRYNPYGCVAVDSCPSVSWSVAESLDGKGNFTIASSANRIGNSSYVSFAFANGTKMEHALFVIDCYESNGTIAVGTSVNTLVNTTKNNVDDPTQMSRLTNVAVAKSNGMLTCSFTLDYAVSTLSNATFYVMLAEGTMNTTLVASPKKNYHTQKFVSASYFATMLRNSAASTTASPASMSTKTSAAAEPQALLALTIVCFLSALKTNLA